MVTPEKMVEYLVSEKSYKNFYLKGKFKILKEDNSGVFIRKHPDSTNITLTNTIECNIYDHNGYTHAYSSGAIVPHARAWAGMVHYKDWNSFEIFTKDDLVIMYLNGFKRHLRCIYRTPLIERGISVYKPGPDFSLIMDLLRFTSRN